MEMERLANVPSGHVNATILKELSAAGIEAKQCEPQTGDVQYRFIGKFENIIFRRGWNFWFVTGDFSKSLKDEIEKSDGIVPNGAKNIYSIKTIKALKSFATTVKKFH